MPAFCPPSLRARQAWSCQTGRRLRADVWKWPQIPSWVLHQPLSSSMISEVPTFTLRESVDTEAVAAFLQVLWRSVRFMTSSFAWMYMNAALARRDTFSRLQWLRSQADRQHDTLAFNAGSHSQSCKRVYPAAPSGSGPKRKSAVAAPPSALPIPEVQGMEGNDVT